MRLIKALYMSNSVSAMTRYKRLPEDTLDKVAPLSDKDKSNMHNAKPMNYKELEKKRLKMEILTIYK